MKECFKCGKGIDDDAYYCPECGEQQKIEKDTEIEKLEKIEKKEKIKCIDCGKEIDFDSIFCTYCGGKQEAGHKGKLEEKKEFSLKSFFKSMMNYKGLILIVLIIASLTIFFYVVNKPAAQKDIKVEFSDVPGNYSGSVILVMQYAAPLNESQIKYLDEFLSYMDKDKIPITIFFTAQSIKNGTKVQDYITTDPELGFNASFLKKYPLVEAEISGYINAPYDSFRYEDQEQLIKQSKKALRKYGFNASGIMLPGGKYNTDTLLAIENNKLDFGLISGPESYVHPPSLLGGKMSLILFSLSQSTPNNLSQISDGVHIFMINNEVLPSINAQLSMGMNMIGSSNINGLWITNLKQQDAFIREKEKISAQLVTNLRSKQSTLSIINLLDGTKVKISTELKPASIKYGNNSFVNFTKKEKDFSFVLNKNQSNILITWD